MPGCAASQGGQRHWRRESKDTEPRHSTEAAISSGDPPDRSKSVSGVYGRRVNRKPDQFLLRLGHSFFFGWCEYRIE